MRFTNFFRVGKLRLEDIKGHPSHSFISVEWVFPQGASLFILREKKKEFRLLLGNSVSLKGELNILLF